MNSDMNKDQPKNVFVTPPLCLLKKGLFEAVVDDKVRSTALLLQQVISSFHIDATVTDVQWLPYGTRYEVTISRGSSIKEILRIKDDIMMYLSCYEILIAPIYEKGVVAIDIVKSCRKQLQLRNILESEALQNCNFEIPIIFGYAENGRILIDDLKEISHILIAGTTGSGKTMFIQTLLISILYQLSPDKIRCLIIQPDKSDLVLYNGMPHLLLPVITTYKQAVAALDWLIMEMNHRYKEFAAKNTNTIAKYNNSNPESVFPYMLVIIDNISDIDHYVLDQVNRALDVLMRNAATVGIYFIIVSTRPVTDIISSSVKVNMTSRVSFSLKSATDSRTILNAKGAKKLHGNGEMLLLKKDSNLPIHIQGAYVSDEEVMEVIDYVRHHNISKPMREEEPDTSNITFSNRDVKIDMDVDEYFQAAARFAITKNKVSIGMFQRLFNIGFSRATRIMDQLAAKNIIGEENGTIPREALMTMEEFELFSEESVKAKGIVTPHSVEPLEDCQQEFSHTLENDTPSLEKEGEYYTHIINDEDHSNLDENITSWLGNMYVQHTDFLLNRPCILTFILCFVTFSLANPNIERLVECNNSIGILVVLFIPPLIITLLVAIIRSKCRKH